MIANPKDYALAVGERMTVDTPDAQTVVFNLPAPKPGQLDDMGMKDTDGDGFYEPLNSDRLVLDLQFSTQGIPREVVQYVKQMMTDINGFQSLPNGTPEPDAIGARLVENMVSNTLFIGTVLAPGVIDHRNAQKNVTEFKTHWYEYYWQLL